jgi:Calcineurin-like phosphoesterase/FG-GAP-like repeat
MTKVMLRFRRKNRRHFGGLPFGRQMVQTRQPNERHRMSFRPFNRRRVIAGLAVCALLLLTGWAMAQSPDFQNRIFEAPTTFANESDGTWLMADWDRDGIPELIFIKTSNTPNGHVEVHVASRNSNYQTRVLETPTTFVNENDGTWLMADFDRDGIPDLIFIKTSNTPNGHVEVHVASGNSNYQTRVLETPATFVNENDGTWLMADWDRDGIPDLIFIKTSNTPNGHVEVHVASGNSNYQTRVLETPTTFVNENDGTWLMADWDRDGIPDLIFIKTSNTPNGHVEVHVASGNSNYQTRVLETPATFVNENDYVRLTAAAGRGITTGVSAPRYVWVQMLEDNDGRRPGGRLVRAIVTDGDRCPSVVVSGVPEVMEVRRPPAAKPFPILLCEARLDAMSDAWIGNQHLPVRPANVTDMIVLGDTGCRITHFRLQECSDGEKWPFASVASKAARIIGSNVQPVILHLGDFHYREKPCADADAGCGGTPFGDNWETWEEEFFRPARPLLAAAPWIMLRGNHENCERAGAGWLFLFDLQSYKGVCQEDREPHKLTIGGSADHPHVLVVFDTANEDDKYDFKKKRFGTYAQWVEQLKIPGADVWLALHQPLWHCGYKEDLKDTRDPAGSRRAQCKEPKPPEGPLTKIREPLSAPTGSAASLVSVVLSGDIHMFQLFAPKQGGHRFTTLS